MTRRLWAVVVLVLVVGLLPAGPQNRLIPAAATVIINVDSTLDTSDAVPGNGVCDDGGGNCTLRAAVDEANALAGTDTINVPAGTYTLGLSLHPSDDLIVVGAGADTTTLHAEGDIAFWLWDGPVTLTVSGFTFTNAGGGDCILITDDHILQVASAAGSTLNVSDSVFDHCGDAGILAATDNSDPAIGGPVYVNVWDSEFLGGGSNSCGASDGGCYGVLIDSHGGSFTATNITVTNTRHSGLLLAFNDGDATVDIIDSAIDSNLSVGVEVFVSEPFAADITISGTSLDDNAYGGSGFQAIWGGNDLSSWTITDTSISGNARWAAELRGAAVIERSTIVNNGFGVSGTETRPALALYGMGTKKVSDSMVAGNAGYGLAMWADPGTTMSVINSTVTGNKWGVTSTGSLLEFVNTTIANNLEEGVEVYTDSTTFVNTIVYNNTLDCFWDAGGPITSLGHNMEGDGTCGFTATGDKVGVDPLLGPLADNGGQTETMALLVGSPAIDAGNDLECPPTDQRGFIRPVDGDGVGGAECDIGAFEAGAGVTPPPGAVAVLWDSDLTRHRLVPLDGSFDVTVLGDAGAAASATVDLVSWY